MTQHELKTDPAVFDAVARGVKTHEIRLNDRNFKVGDMLVLRETRYSGAEMAMYPGMPLVYTGRAALREVSHVQTGYGLEPGWCILSFAESGNSYGDDYAAGLEHAARLVEQALTGTRRIHTAMAIRQLKYGRPQAATTASSQVDQSMALPSTPANSSEQCS